MTLENFHTDFEFNDGLSEYDEGLTKDAAFDITMNTIESLDKAVRSYLAYIDLVYGTDYAPEGSSPERYLINKKDGE